MANIEKDLQAIMDARYGRDVRQSIHDAIYDINEVNEANISTVQTIANTAQGYANNASDSADTAEQAKTNAQQQVALATTQAENASDSAEDSEAWAVGKRAGVDVPNTDPTYENNAKYWQAQANYWYLQAKAIAEGFSGALRPMGTVTFANLPSVASATAGDMYNVSDEFTTTSDFEEGAGHTIPLGSNVYKTLGGKWDVLAGSPVTGIKGDSESSYRRGNVNITKGNIGLGNVDNESLGSANISSIGDGTVKGAISSLDSSVSGKVSKTGDTISGDLTIQRANGNTSWKDMDGTTLRRHIWAGMANSNGTFYLYDSTNNKDIITSPKTGTATFRGQADTVRGFQRTNNTDGYMTIIANEQVNGMDGMIIRFGVSSTFAFDIGVQWSTNNLLFRKQTSGTWGSWITK